MGRPQKWYIVFEYGKVIAIVHGLASLEARAIHYGAWAFPTQLAAEEFAAWWGYDHAPRH